MVAIDNIRCYAYLKSKPEMPGWSLWRASCKYNITEYWDESGDSGIIPATGQPWVCRKFEAVGWTLYYGDFSCNPHTGNPWVLSEIGDFQWGIHLLSTGQNTAYCTQLWWEIQFADATTMIFRPPTDSPVYALDESYVYGTYSYWGLGCDKDGSYFYYDVTVRGQFPTDPMARVSSIRRIYHPGLYRMELGLGALGFNVDVPEASIRRVPDEVAEPEAQEGELPVGPWHPAGVPYKPPRPFPYDMPPFSQLPIYPQPTGPYHSIVGPYQALGPPVADIKLYQEYLALKVKGANRNVSENYRFGYLLAELKRLGYINL